MIPLWQSHLNIKVDMFSLQSTGSRRCIEILRQEYVERGNQMVKATLVEGFEGFEPLDMEEDWVAAMTWELSWNGSVPEKNTQAFEHG